MKNLEIGGNHVGAKIGDIHVNFFVHVATSGYTIGTGHFSKLVMLPLASRYVLKWED